MVECPLLGVVVLAPMAAAILGFLIGRVSKSARDLFADAVTGVELLLFVLLLNGILKGNTYYFSIPSVCGLGLYFKMDGFRVLVGLVGAFMWFLTTLMSNEYLSHYRNRNRYYLFVLVTLGATMGVFLSADLYTTFIFFEIMSFTSYVWVAQDERAESLEAAGTYLAVAVIGGLTLLMGIFMIYSITGTLRMDELTQAVKSVWEAKKTSICAAGGLMLFGFGAKAGMFPLHIWLPKAHPVAPAPASALLSGILTKTGIIGIIAITCNLFLYDSKWGMVILLLGAVTMFTGALLALFSVDMKRILACSSISQIGFILVGIGMQCFLGEENILAVRGTFLHMVNHSVIKLVLFMGAGVVFMNLHALNLNEIRGFGRKKGLLKISFLIGSLGIMGIPMFNGYISKTLLHESILEYKNHAAHLAVGMGFWNGMEALFLFTGGLTIAYMLKLFVAVFIEKHPSKQAEMDGKYQKYCGKATAFALFASMLLPLILGIFTGSVTNRIADWGQAFMKAEQAAPAVAYFSMENMKGALITIVIGVVVYFCVVRTFMMADDQEGNRIYVNRWPDGLDLERGVYRPVLLVWLPGIASFICRGLDQAADGIILLCRKTTHRQLSPVRKQYGFIPWYVAYANFITKVCVFLNKKVLKKTRITMPALERFIERRLQGSKTRRMIITSMSFGLLMFCTGFVITLLYLLKNNL